MEEKKTLILELIEKRDWVRLKELLADLPVPEVADFLSEIDKQQRVLLYRALPRTIAAEVFSYLDSFQQDALLRDLTDEEARHIMANLAPDDRTELLEELPAEATRRLLSLLSPEDLAEARSLLGYPERSVGRLMTPDYVAVKPDWTIAEALEHIRKTGRDRETVYSVYVTGPDSRLLGFVTLRQLVLDPPNKPIYEIMKPTPSVTAFDNREVAAEVMERHNLWVLPVTDSQGIFVGIVTGDDVFEMVTTETTEDFHKAAGVSPLRVSLKDASSRLLYRNRVTWLVGLTLVYLVTGRIMQGFEATISHAVALVFFLPLLIDSAGNAGSQSAVLMVRALGVGDVELKDWTKVLLKELAVSGTMGSLMGLVVFAVAAITEGFQVGLVTGVTMLVSVVATCLIGVFIPFLLSKLNFDPASASSPLVTSIADILGVVIYFSMASWLMGL